MSKESTKEKVRTAIQPTRQENYPEWYQAVVQAADLADNAPVRGCMVMKPWGYGIWEQMQRQLNDRILETGHENAYFPLFIPLSFLEKEATHVEGFAKECAVVTHHRLELKDGKLIPSGELEEPLIVRPTSETIIGHSFARWVESYRDLPLLINQWANVVRWEMRPRLFLRTTEFLWQEGHTVHASAEEALTETRTMLEVYRQFAEDVLAVPVIVGEKSPGERFPGAENTFTIEMMMQDRKALQGGTSHYLGQNFAKASGIRFTNDQGELEYGYTTSWGCTTRLIGAMVMVHSDDDGLRLPPKVAPKQAVIIPVIPKDEHKQTVMDYATQLEKYLSQLTYNNRPCLIKLDARDKRGGEKNWEWIKKGMPIRIEVGPRDCLNSVVTFSRRDRPTQEKQTLPLTEFVQQFPLILDEIQRNYWLEAKAYRDESICTDLETFDHLVEFFAGEDEGEEGKKGASGKQKKKGFVLAKWCGDAKTEELLTPYRVTIRCLPLAQRGTEGRCILTGKPATLDAIFAKSY